MAHALYKLRSKVFNTPQLMNLNEFEGIVEYINDRCLGIEMSEDEVESSSKKNSRYSYNPDVQAAVINLEGPTTYKPTFWASLCGGFDYQTLKSDFVELAELGVKVVAFHIDSPGGEAHQMIDSANFIRKVADDYGITILSYVDGMAASAGYGIACISDQIIMSADSTVGSIGVVVRLMNDNKRLEKEGYQRTYLTAGNSKVPFDEDGEFKEEFINDLQSKINTLYESFTGHVATHRNISVEKVRSTEAKTFLPSAAIELGLADGEMTVEEFYSHLADVAQHIKGSDNTMFTKNKLFLKKEDEIDMTELAQMQGKIAELEASLAEANTAVAELTSVKQELEKAQAQLSETQSALAEAQAVAEAVAKEKEEMKAQSRKEKLSAVLPAEKVEAIAATLMELSDEAFEVVLTGYSSVVSAAEEGDLFVEMGTTTPEVQTKSDEVDHTARLLKERFGN